ncbi:MAG: DUF4365 domain-containing protein [Tepidisphaeraceae bacterium]
MKYPQSRRIENEGVLHVDAVVTTHGSIFRRIHQESDIGVDGIIEIVLDEVASGLLVAVQIKSGDSYLSADRSEFRISVDDAHLAYWANYAIPVIVVAFSPSLKKAAWTLVRDHPAIEEQEGKSPVGPLRIPLHRKFDVDSLANDVASLARVRVDERMLIECAEKCLSDRPEQRNEGLVVLTSHPKSRDLKIVCDLARRLLMDESRETASEAMWALGYGVGRSLWSWDPHNLEERKVIDFAHQLCKTLTKEEAKRCLELIDDEPFGGPSSLGTYCYFVLQAAWHVAEDALYQCIRDTREPFQRRIRAFWIYYDGETADNLDNGEIRAGFLADDVERDLYLAWFPEPADE